ncbi:MAG: hypothetical protein J5511_00015 [Bacilli bacterium]|nr:hypothetical protein [Bacilli bacterium]
MKYKYYGHGVKGLTPINNNFPYIKSPRDLYDILTSVWSRETCSPKMRKEWTEKNKPWGQCSITSFLAQDIFGGEVYAVPIEGDLMHCFNVVDGKMFDLTSEQFANMKLTYNTMHYQDRDRALFFDKEKEGRYLLLKQAVIENGEKILKKKKAKRVVGRVFGTIGCLLAAVVVLAGAYVGYVLLSYNRIGNIDLKVGRRSVLQQVEVGTTYKALTYNLGFGAYSQDYTFFLDTGYDDDGNATCGHYSTAKSKAVVEFNTLGAIDTALAAQADFVFFQEVDTNSTRSYHVNQDMSIIESYPEYDHVHAKNFHSAFLPYPLYDMHGAVQAGLTTVSKYQIQSAQRKEYTISSSFSKFFDLDRCFSVSQIKVENGKNLWMVNSHMSAYDSGGTIREKQVQELNAFLKEKKAANDYVVVGGDWNHDLLTYNPDYSYTLEEGHRAFNMTKKTPDWVSYYFEYNGEKGKTPLTEGYKMVASDNTPTCRNNDIEWDPNKTFVCCIDGFVVSDNIEVIEHHNIQTKNGNKGLDGFAFADHDPAYIEFKLL